MQAALYLVAGANHLLHPAAYLRMMPPHYASPAPLVLWSGIAEIAGGLGLLLPYTRRAAAVGITLMLLVYLDVHVWMAMHAGAWAPVPAWAVYLRIPLQFVLIAWALRYARAVPGF